VMREMSARGLGCTAVVDDDQRPIGIFTDGDLRRLIERGGDVSGLCAQDIMHRHPRTVIDHALAVDAAGLMESAHIHNVLVVNAAGTLIGALTYNDLLTAKVI
jgi:arabinose-5-phosphate isomerase